MTKLEFITTQLSDPKLLKDLATVVEDPQSLIPQTEAEFQDLCKFGLYPAEDCQPFTTKQGTPFYSLDNMSVLPIHEEDRWMHYGDFRFRQIEILYNIVRMDSVDAHNWLRDNLFQKRVDARKKTEYKAKFRGCHRQDWKKIQTEWMKYCLNLKYRDNFTFRKDLHSTDKIPVEDATATNYASNLFWVPDSSRSKARSTTSDAMSWASFWSSFARPKASFHTPFPTTSTSSVNLYCRYNYTKKSSGPEDFYKLGRTKLHAASA